MNAKGQFYFQPFDRHVAWCAEKMRRMSNSPKKDMLALAKLHARTGYRPKTPRSGRDTASPAPRYARYTRRHF